MIARRKTSPDAFSTAVARHLLSQDIEKIKLLFKAPLSEQQAWRMRELFERAVWETYRRRREIFEESLGVKVSAEKGRKRSRRQLLEKIERDRLADQLMRQVERRTRRQIVLSYALTAAIGAATVIFGMFVVALTHRIVSSDASTIQKEEITTAARPFSARTCLALPKAGPDGRAC